ncbi:MAG: hypothetical protein KAT65_15485, partial [Methanophagales archaeon]|nr:hypothetical protein [Methanophagales archaeon]
CAGACDSESAAVLIRAIYRKLVLLVIPLRLLRLPQRGFTYGDTKKGKFVLLDNSVIMPLKVCTTCQTAMYLYCMPNTGYFY